jgi:hypothetical protein
MNICREKRLPFILIGQRQYRFSKVALINWIENAEIKQVR